MSVLHIADFDRAVPPTVAGIPLTPCEFSWQSVDENIGSLLTAGRFLGPEATTGDHCSVTESLAVTGRLVVAEDPVAFAACSTTATIGVACHRSDVSKHEREARKPVDPKLRDFVKRIFVPALVKRYILAVKREGFVPLSSGIAS